MLSTIRLNDNNDFVKVAQYMLNYVESKKATGIFDERFAAEVGDWQAQHNLTTDYIIGPKTWEAIAKTMPTCSTSKNKKSAYTCAIQILVGGLEVDGDYGSKTKKAVAAYQSAAGLESDGVCGQKTWTMLITGEKAKTASTGTGTGAGQTTSGSKVLNNCVKYLQWDSKWKNVKYSTHTRSQTIGNSGCGPSSMAMILATWENSKITPVECCDEAFKNGYRTYNSGTAWGYFKYVFKNHPCFQKYVETSSVTTLSAALREGALAVCSMNSNDNKFWTSSGHFIVARGCDDTYIYANDPNKSETPRKQASNKFQSCMKQAFIFWPIAKEEPPKKEEKDEEIPIEIPLENDEPIPEQAEIIIDEDIPEGELRFDMNLDGAIIDISKWQGTIDFKKLKKEVGLVIARASCGSDKDVKFDEYAKAMVENKIPFGVYCYSYAGDEAKAKDEAKKMVSYANKYDPLFYIMDAEEAKITTAAIKAFAKELRKNTSERIGCYVAHNRYNTYKYDTLKSLFDITWIPRYGKNDGTIAGSTKPAYDCDLWQYTSTGKIAGINGNVDKNITMNDKKDLKWLLTNFEED